MAQSHADNEHDHDHLDEVVVSGTHAALVRERGLRVTASRLAVLELLERSADPLTHHEVVDRLKTSSWNRSTLYRNLIDLTEVGLLQKSEIGGLARFERSGKTGACAEHPHFVCTDCGTVSHLESVTVLFEGRGPTAVMSGQVAVQLRGKCDDCP
jgi:Fur family ferric uptake transcriptional regulator